METFAFTLTMAIMSLLVIEAFFGREVARKAAGYMGVAGSVLMFAAKTI